MTMKQRFCKFCPTEITKEWPRLKTLCDDPECVEKHRQEKLAYMRIKSKERYDKLKLAKRTITKCLKCGGDIPFEQDTRRDVCLDEECIAWWLARIRKRKIRNQLRRYHEDKPKKVAPAPIPVKQLFLAKVKEEDYFDQKMFDKQEAEFNKPNGRVCEYPGCGEKLKGNYRKLCPFHNGVNAQKANGIMWENGWDGGDVGERRSVRMV